MRKVFAAIALMLSLISLSACGDDNEQPYVYMWVETIDVNGQKVPCIMWAPEERSGIQMDCNWNAAQ